MKQLFYNLLHLAIVGGLVSCQVEDIHTGPRPKFKYEVVMVNNSHYRIDFSTQGDNNFVLMEPQQSKTIYSGNSFEEVESIDDFIIKMCFVSEMVVSYDDNIFITLQRGDTFHSPYNSDSYTKQVDGVTTTFTFTFTDEDYEYATMYGSPAVEKFIRE